MPYIGESVYKYNSNIQEIEEYIIQDVYFGMDVDDIDTKVYLVPKGKFQMIEIPLLDFFKQYGGSEHAAKCIALAEDHSLMLTDDNVLNSLLDEVAKDIDNGNINAELVDGMSGEEFRTYAADMFDQFKENIDVNDFLNSLNELNTKLMGKVNKEDLADMSLDDLDSIIQMLTEEDEEENEE